MATKRHRILTEIKTRLLGATSAADRVYIGRLTFDSDDTYPIVSIIPSESAITDARNERKMIELPIDVIIALNADHNDVSTAIEDMIGSIKAAIESGSVDKFYDFGTDRAKLRHISDGGYQQEDSSEFITVSIAFSIQYMERVGDPNT